ncbi:MAG: hypothetical protein EBT22_12240 [Chloroflexi bacterium]|nr:hypothetical protein [Chloroflexota bacterium]
MDAVSYPDRAVADLIGKWMVPLRLTFGNPLHRETLRGLGALWTPTLWVLDRNGREFRRETGYLEPSDLHSVLSEGVALALVSGGRAPEASLRYWRGAVGYLRSGDHVALDAWWDQVRLIDGNGPWARRCV